VPYGEPKMLARRAMAIVNALRNAKHLDKSAPVNTVIPITRLAYAIIGIYPKNLKGGVDEEECPVCYFSFEVDPRPKAEGLLLCDHNGKFHAHCLQQWLDTRLTDGCPLCRARPTPTPERRQVELALREALAQEELQPNPLMRRTTPEEWEEWRRRNERRDEEWDRLGRRIEEWQRERRAERYQNALMFVVSVLSGYLFFLVTHSS
jgi:hypothetical protein